MKKREEIESIALEFFPVRLDFHGNDTNQSQRTAFVLGWQLCQKHYEQKLLLIEMGKEHDTMTESALNMGRTLSMCDDNEDDIGG